MATKYGIPNFRSAVNGIDMVIEADGTIHDETKLFTDVADVVSVHAVRVPTAYQSWGWLFPYFCLVISIGVIVKTFNYIRFGIPTANRR